MITTNPEIGRGQRRGLYNLSTVLPSFYLLWPTCVLVPILLEKKRECFLKLSCPNFNLFYVIGDLFGSQGKPVMVGEFFKYLSQSEKSQGKQISPVIILIISRIPFVVITCDLYHFVNYQIYYKYLHIS